MEPQKYLIILIPSIINKVESAEVFIGNILQFDGPSQLTILKSEMKMSPFAYNNLYISMPQNQYFLHNAGFYILHSTLLAFQCTLKSKCELKLV